MLERVVIDMTYYQRPNSRERCGRRSPEDVAEFEVSVQQLGPLSG